VAFYSVTGRDFFPGAVALLNSLRLLGHDEPLLVVDCGMTARQRDLLAEHATVLAAPGPAPPSVLKLVAPQAHPAEVMVLLDADVIVTRPLTELFEAAAGGTLVAFRNDRERYFAEWGELLGLGPVRADPYLTSSAVMLGREAGKRLLPLIDELQAGIDRERTWVGGGAQADPLYYLDQDVLNAVAHSRLAPERVVALDARLAPIPPFAGVRLLEPQGLRCAYRDGARPYLLHHASRKPWLVRMRSSVYSRLLTRLLLAPDVALRLDPRDLPLVLRTGSAAGAARLATDLLMTAPGAVRRLRRRPAPVRAWPNSPAP